MANLRITEIFYSIQGESYLSGWPSVFIRLTGCPLRCQYCDTAYAFQGGEILSIEDILKQVAFYSPQYVCVTGGEPLAQKDCLFLLSQLCDRGYIVSLETSGALDILCVDSRVIKIVDLKTPGSGQSHKNFWSNFDKLLPHDQLKIVVCSYQDYQWAKHWLQNSNISQKQIVFSPSYHQVQPSDLAEWILKDRLNVRMQVQLHKVLWGDAPGK
ncbi:MAG: 7-carboxy-7-deazaguanine synthase QueE [Proteobacteria bacterium]|nr:7-carboxy-7-deazaguanine synthase QueE [Pseudomonadota bacterium]